MSAIGRREARLTVALLFGVNFLNYIDRYVIAAVLPLIQAEFLRLMKLLMKSGSQDRDAGYVRRAGSAIYCDRVWGRQNGHQKRRRVRDLRVAGTARQCQVN